MLKENLKDWLKELHLPTIRKGYQELAQKAEKEGVTYEEYLGWLAQEEIENRREKRVARKLHESKIPSQKTIENFNMDRLPINLSRQIKSLLKGELLKNRENLLIFGSPGSGKTHLLCGIGQHFIQEHRSRIYYTNSTKLMQELLDAKTKYQLPKMIKKLTSYDALIIDDIGYIEQSKEEVEVLFTLISESYEKTSILLTSNLPFSKWDKIFKDPMITVAAIDRLIHHSIVLEMNVDSYRLEESKRKQTKKNAVLEDQK